MTEAYLCTNCFEDNKNSLPINDPRYADEFAGYASNLDEKCYECEDFYAILKLETDVI